MSNQVILALAAGLVAGGVGAVATSALMPAPGAPSPGNTAAVLEPGGDVSEQLRALTDAQSQVLERLAKLEANASMAAPTQIRMPASAGNELVDLDALVAAAVAKLNTAPSGAVVTPDFRKQVEAVLAMNDEEERLKREQERIQREAQVLEDRLARLQSDLGLDSRQVDGMRKIYQEADQKREEMRNAMRDTRGTGAGFQEMRTQWTALADAMDQQVRGVLTPTQYDTYKASNQDRGFGGRGPDFGAGGGPGGGNAAGGTNAGGGRRRGGNNAGGNNAGGNNAGG